MFNDRWKRSDQAGGRAVTSPAPHTSHTAGALKEAPRSRNSNGLEQFFSHIRGESGLNLLDLSGASQANIGFITNLGHRLYSEDLIATLDLTFGPGDIYERQLDPERASGFLESNLNFPPGHFDGALLWDALEFLAPPLLKAVVERLHAILKPNSYLFALFHMEDRCDTVPSFYYRIGDARTLMLVPRGSRRPAQFFSNRAVEKLFQDFSNVKFFLTRDNLREVILKR